MKIRTLILTTLIFGTGIAHAAVLGEWNFDAGSTSAERRSATNLAAGVASLSALDFNTFDDVGFNAVPNSVHDGIGFGGSNGEQVAFIHRANYFDGNGVPPKENASDFTSFGAGATQGTSAGQGDGNATVSFTITAGVQAFQVESITVDQVHQSSASLIVGFQESGASAGSGVTLNAGNTGLGTALLPSPVAVGAGQTKTFTISLNSGALNTSHNVNYIQLNGSEVPQYVRGAMLGQWTFDDDSSSATLLESSSPVAGATVSSLAINANVTDFGNGAVPSGDDDGMGFGGNNGERVIFWHRANYTNTNAPVGKTTIWGVPGVDAGIDTTVGSAPMSFTVTAGAVETLTVESLLINNSSGGGGCRAHFQEAGQAAGSANGGGRDALVPLNEPVVIAPGTTKTFTINWSGDSLDIKQNINRIDLRGTISSGGAQETVRTKLSQAVGTATPPAGWSFHWNAPSNWVAGVEPGDLLSGAVSDTNSWLPMVWGGGMWTADGNSNGGDSTPDKYLRITGTGGHPGEAGATRELDRYAIASFTVDKAGDYQLGQGWIEKAVSAGNGLLVKIFAKGQLVKTVECEAGDMAHFEARMENMAVGNEISVAVGSNGDSAHDSFKIDYEIARVDPAFSGLLVYDVATYGAVGDGTTDDFHAIHAAVDAAKAAGGGIVRFESNTTYRVIGDSTDEDVVETVFELEGTYNIKIEGNGASLSLYPADQLTDIVHSENIQIDGFTVGFDPLPYYQGTVDDINVGNLTMDITVPVRYDIPEMGTNTASANRPFFGRSFIPESPGARAGTGQHLYIDSTETIGGDPRKVRLHFRNDMTSNLQDSSAATEMVVPHIRYGHRGTHSIVVNKSSRVKISNLLYRNTPFFLCAPVGNYGPVTLSNFDVLTADPANELFVTWRDGYHVKDNHFGVLIEDGDWHGGGMNDDLFNFAHMMKFVTSVSSNELSLKAANGFGGQNIWQAGDWISVWDPTQKTLRGRARMTGPGSTETWNATLLLDDVIVASSNDWVVNESRLNRGMLVRNCTNSQLGTRPGSARFRTPARFENNHFDGIYFHLHTTTEHEGPVPRDYHFEDTYFKGSPGHAAQPLAVRAGENIVFKNCTVDGGQIQTEEGTEIDLDGVTWTNNTGNVLDLNESSVAYVYNQSTRNGDPVVLGDVSLSGGSQVFFEAVRYLQSMSPASQAFPFTDLVATFSESMTLGSGSITITNLTDGTATVIAASDASQVSLSGTVLTINPDSDLLVGKEYAVLIDEDALSPFGGISSDTTWRFSIVDPASMIILNGDFSSNAALFTTYPGYSGGSNPSAVDEWIYSNTGTGNRGINGDGIQTPFSPSDRSAATYFAFLQHGGSQFAQNLSGRLAPNTTYQISFIAASRSGDSAALGRVTVGDDTATFYNSGTQQWSTAAFESVSAEFTTGASFDGPVVITLLNATAEEEGGVTVDYSNIEIVKVSGYDSWSDEYQLVYGPQGHDDTDGMNNLVEYALGGNPTNNDASAVLPVFQALENHFYYIHNERTDDPGLKYTVESSSNLVSNVWNTNGVEFVNESGISNVWKSVTNRTDIGNAEFLRLKIEQE